MSTLTTEAVTQRAARTDIQGLRAIAVSLVVLYHLWPNRLPGGFIGVDVFFVISGFLITTHLLAHPPRSPRDLASFWGRRIQRLLPASLLVLLTTLVASRLIAPETQWGNTASQARAAALYVVNWALASDAVDYLAAEEAASPVRHFWSLSVEEQFYIFWPVMIFGLAALALRRKLRAQLVVGAGMLLVTLASLAYSVQLTAADPARAYFVTPTRVWELGVGGLLAVALLDRPTATLLRSDRLRAALAWAGIAAIAFSAFWITGASPFPGWRAALPVLGTAAVIAAHAPIGGMSPGLSLSWWPAQRIGDLSYSIYLWHWPIIVLLPYTASADLGRLDKVAVIGLSIVLAAFTKRFVEDPFRSAAWRRPLKKPFIIGVTMTAVVVGASFAQDLEISVRESAAQADLRQAIADRGPCFGAAALSAAPGECATSDVLIPVPAQAAQDKSAAYPEISGGQDCFSYVPDFPARRCAFGPPSAEVNLALVGNSHAGQWLPAVQEIASQRGWRVTTFLASRCALAQVPQEFDTVADSAACRTWGHETVADLAAGHFDLVVMTNRVSVPVLDQTLGASWPMYERGYEDVLRALSRADLPVVGIRDTPAPLFSIPDCLADNVGDPQACEGARSDWLPREPLAGAIDAVDDPSIVLADLTEQLCPDETCPAVIGQVPVYFDGSHMTATYARTLAAYLGPTLEQMTERGNRDDKP